MSNHFLDFFRFFFPKFIFWPKFRFFTDISFLTKKWFLTNISIFNIYFDFWQKIHFLTEISIFDRHFVFDKKMIFDKHFAFWQKIHFLIEISIFDTIFLFCFRFFSFFFNNDICKINSVAQKRFETLIITTGFPKTRDVQLFFRLFFVRFILQDFLLT